MKTPEAEKHCAECLIKLERNAWERTGAFLRRDCSAKYRFKNKPNPDFRSLKGRVVNTEEKFWSLVNKSDGCWLWTGSKNENGYGVFSYRGKEWRAHRLAYFFINGHIPEDEKACHQCDTPACVNPHHIFLGSQTENIKDCVSKNRNQRGERSGHAKLTELDVIAIRGDSRSGKLIGEQYGISRNHANSIKKGTFWKSL